jgi:predicted RNA-binding Zn-ribbon protein involved in translation (DUF1610 family)
MSQTVQRCDVENEFRVCPACGYERGFHASFVRVGDDREFAVHFICPSCGAVFDLGLSVRIPGKGRTGGSGMEPGPAAEV